MGPVPRSAIISPKIAMVFLIVATPCLSGIIEQDSICIYILSGDDQDVRQGAVDVDSLSAGSILIEHLSNLLLSIVKDGHVEAVMRSRIIRIRLLILDDMDAAPAGAVGAGTPWC